jgi:uncharacterized membrane protein
VSRGDELEPASSAPPSGFEGFFANYGIVLAVVGFCCNVCFIFTILGIVGLVTFKDPKAKQNALIVTIASAVGSVIGIIIGVASNAMQHH